MNWVINMTAEPLFIIICLVLGLILGLSITYTYKHSFSCDYSNDKNADGISFKEAIDLTNFPIITLVNNNIKLNFLLDTGSSVSHINKVLFPKLITSESDYNMNITGVEGNPINTKFCEIEVYYKNQVFSNEFAISNLDAVFNSVKKETGVQLHGILGSDFFQKYRYVIDFDKFIVYPAEWTKKKRKKLLK